MTTENGLARIGKTVVIRGEVKGSEDLIVDGHVEGTIGLADNAGAGNGTVRLRLELEPFGTKFIVVGAVPPGAAAKR